MNVKEEKFVKIAEQRTNKILKMLELLGNCSNVYAYEYTDDQVKKIFDAIEEQLKDTKEKFKTSKTVKKEFKL